MCNLQIAKLKIVIRTLTTQLITIYRSNRKETTQSSVTKVVRLPTRKCLGSKALLDTFQFSKLEHAPPKFDESDKLQNLPFLMK